MVVLDSGMAAACTHLKGKMDSFLKESKLNRVEKAKTFLWDKNGVLKQEIWEPRFYGAKTAFQNKKSGNPDFVGQKQPFKTRNLEIQISCFKMAFLPHKIWVSRFLVLKCCFCATKSGFPDFLF